MKINLYKSVILILLFFSGTNVARLADLVSLEPVNGNIRAVRFDPSYYYDSSQKIAPMCESLVEKWQSAGVNTIFYKVYDPIYGAKYQTFYDLNIMAEYGEMDLLKHMIKAASDRGIGVVAWIPAFQHKNVWEKNPSWRVKTSDRKDYRPSPDSYFLCPANPEFRKWWLGFVKDLLQRYPELQGVDIAEPIIGWKNNRCYCNYCAASDSNYSSVGMMQTITETISLIHQSGKISVVTTITTPTVAGGILSPIEQQQRTGFDLESLLNSRDFPDWINVELMWQQWAKELKRKDIFTVSWVKSAIKAFNSLVDNRTRLMAHLELTSFTDNQVDMNDLITSIRMVKEAGIQDIDIYDTHLIDDQNGWSTLTESWLSYPLKHVLVMTDSLGENDSRQVATLLSHFNTDVKLDLTGEILHQSNPDLNRFQIIFYVGVSPKFRVPEQFLKRLANDYAGKIIWINYGIESLLQEQETPLWDLTYQGVQRDSSFNIVEYKSRKLPKEEPLLNIIHNSDSLRNVLAWVSNGSSRLPYAVRTKNLWYFADLPTSFVVEGGRHIVFADLLHDILDENHRNDKIALVRIEDIHPLTDPESLREITEILKSTHVPFSFAVVPFYLDPSSNTTVSLSDHPELVSALKEMAAAGGTLVMHGVTHQYRGETTADYEFWDRLSASPIFEDSKEYVEQRIEMGLSEFHNNGLYPLLWETPHYGASQLDYKIINQYFDTAYERRQTINLHGSDQLLPYLVYHHTSGGKIVPENLGYIPLDNPDPTALLEAADNNMAVRDGVASFFFHPFVDHDALRIIVTHLKKSGYVFCDPRLTSTSMHSPNFQALTGSGEVNLVLNSRYLHTFFLDQNGELREEMYSDSLVSDTFSREIEVPLGWIYIAEALANKPESFWNRKLADLQSRLPQGVQELFGDTKIISLAGYQPLIPAILVDSGATGKAHLSEQNLLRSLTIAGVDPLILTAEKFIEVPEDINLLVIPFSAALNLNEQQTLFVIRALQNGLNVVFERPSSLTDRIGIQQLGNPIRVKQVTDTYYPQVNITWHHPDTVRTFDSDIDYVTYYQEKSTETPLVIGGEYGNGKYLYISSYFDPYTPWGYSRYPYFIDLLKREFQLGPFVRRRNLEIYFEPGDREDISIEELVAMWHQNGVRKIFVSAWHFYENYTYDYQRLIELAHQHAMQVYAWLEFPHVSEKFWNEHPEWREITADGKEARIDWRRHMALSIPECRSAVFQFVKNLLINYDWDGINLAELYFESSRGFREPQNFTPMNNFILKKFKTQYGFDAKTLFDRNSPKYWKINHTAAREFMEFRKKEIINLHQQFLEFFKHVSDSLNMHPDIIVTTVDDRLSPDIGDAIGVDAGGIAQLAGNWPFTLQIEDPQKLWPLGPERYTRIKKSFNRFSQNSPLLMDINVVPYRDMKISTAPTRQPSGLELFNLVNSARSEDDRLSLYSEASMYEVDFPMIQYVLASGTQVQFNPSSWIVESPRSVTIILDKEVHESIVVNDEIWSAYYQGQLILPKGKYTIQPASPMQHFFNKLQSQVKLIDLSAELLDIHSGSRGISFRYHTRISGLAVLSEQPHKIIVDGADIKFHSVKGALGYVVSLPSGEHEVYVYTKTITAYLMQIASIIISGIIVTVGIVATFVLLIMYLKNVFRRQPVLARQPE